MPTTIESLELEVQSSSTSATNGIDALSASLSKLKNAVKGGVGLTSVTNQLKGLNTALQGIDSSAAGKLDTLTNSLSKLSGLGNLKISSSIGNQLKNIGSAATALNGVNFSGITNLSTALSSLSSLGKSNLSSFITQLGKLPQLAQTLAGMNMTQFINQLTQLSNALAPLASQLNTVSTAFTRLPANIRSVVTATNAMSTANNTATTSYMNLWAGLRMARAAVMSTARVIASWITESNSYIENLNLFTASMGEYTAQARSYAEQVGEIMGIDPGEWMRNQGVFMTITEGFGVASDRAYTMSQNLTQLGYDLSSFFNISFKDSMQKLTSGISGELEPLRRLGYDLSQARLQQEALNLGIDKSISSMTQAEKAQLRYYAIMTQVTTAQGDMARTLTAPANQLRIMQAQVTQVARALGNLFIPVLNMVLPYLIAFAKVLRMVINLIGTFVGFELPEVDYSGISAGADAVGDLTDAEGDATKAAKKLKNALLGIDELNVISPSEDSDSGSGSAIAGGSDLGFELPEYDFLGGAINDRIEELVRKFKEWAGLTDDIDTWAEFFQTKLGKILEDVIGIGVAFGAWKVATGLVKFIEMLSNFKGLGGGVGALGLLTFLSDLNEFVQYFHDFTQNGATFQNVTGMISEFVGMVGDSLILLGSYKIGGALKVAQGVGEICVAIKDISESGVDWNNATTAVRGLTNIAIGIGVFTGNIKFAAWGVAIQGFTSIIGELGENWEAIKQGDWSGVDKVTLIIGGLEILGGLVVALDVFSKLKGLAGATKATTAVQTVTTATQGLDTTVSSSLTPTLKSLAKNLGLGLVVVAEVAAAALLITGAIILLGMELEQVGIAWSPVLENGATVAIAMGLGVTILAGIGVVTALLGSVGTPLIVNIALGTAILAELGIAAGLFLVEIWAIGVGLDEIGKAWQPVLDNGETIATGIGLGTGLLVAIGVVTAALGVATVASAGLLPLAIGLGTALLVELAAAFIIFTESLVAVADELSNNLSPSLENLNGKLPTLSDNMSDFVDFMTEFAGYVVNYTKVSAIAGLSATIDTIIGWFTEDPIEKLADDVGTIYSQTSDLNEQLALAVPELEEASNLLNDYQNFLTEIETVTANNDNSSLSGGMFVNMKEVGQNLVLGFVDGITSKSSDFSNAGKTIIDGFKDSVTTQSETCKATMTTWATNLKNWFTSTSYGSINATTFGNYGKNIVQGFRNQVASNSSLSKSTITSWASNTKEWFTNSSYGGVNRNTFSNYAKDSIDGFKSKVTSYSPTAKSSMTTFGSNVKSWFGEYASYDKFYAVASDVVNGFKNGIGALYRTCKDTISSWGSSIIDWFKDKLDVNSPSRIFYNIGMFTVEGFNNAITAVGKTTRGVVSNWSDSFTDISPKLALAVDTSAVQSFDPSKVYGRSLSAEVQGSYQMTADGFVEGMEEFYREYIEPTISRMADDVRRQADKEEQTIVQVGNRTVTDAVTTQQRANGYRFAT